MDSRHNLSVLYVNYRTFFLYNIRKLMILLQGQYSQIKSNTLVCYKRRYSCVDHMIDIQYYNSSDLDLHRYDI